jgi:hypothetical protein
MGPLLYSKLGFRVWGFLGFVGVYGLSFRVLGFKDLGFRV